MSTKRISVIEPFKECVNSKQFIAKEKVSRKTNYFQRQKSGFTLIELLVVVSIIALLVSILLPALGKAREQARITVCSSNLHQFNFAFLYYADDNEDRFPSASHCFVTTPLNDGLPYGPCTWHDKRVDINECGGMIWPYLKSPAAALCPSFVQICRTRGEEHYLHDNSSPPVDPIYGYVNNLYCNPKANYGVAEKYSQVESPSEVLFCGEQNTWTTPDLSYCSFCDGNLCARWGGDSAVNVEWIGTFHRTKGTDLDSGGSNVLFVDGHVDLVIPDPTDLDFVANLCWPKGNYPVQASP